MKFKGKKSLFIFAAVITGLILSAAALAAAPARVLILPFTIHSQEDLSFLQKGIADMLSTRLAQEGKVAVISREEIGEAIDEISCPANEKAAIELGTRFNADYVAFGSLTIFGDSISTDANFLDIHTPKTVVSYSQPGTSHGDVIFHINSFAAQVNKEVFGRETAAYQPPVQQPVKLPARTPAQEKEAVPDNRMHPENLLTEQRDVRPMVSEGIPQPGVKKSMALWKSRRLKMKIISLAVGDVDGDGRNETVFISRQKVLIYRYSKGVFEKIGEIKGKGNDSFIGVDVSDKNNNKKAEIFITSFVDINLGLNSFVLEWNGAKFVKIAEKENYYYRVINIPSRGGNILCGQKKGLEDLFSNSGVYELNWNGKTYEEVEKLPLPKGVNIFGFTMGDVLNSGQELILSFDIHDHIKVVDTDGEEKWRSSEPFGGNDIVLKSHSKNEPDEKDFNYLPHRIHIADLNNDGKNEVVVVKNKEYAGRFFSRIRSYQNGHIEVFNMDQLGPVPVLKTRKVTKFISDYIIADLNNDGHMELVYSVVTKTGSVIGKASSFIVSQGIN